MSINFRFVEGGRKLGIPLTGTLFIPINTILSYPSVIKFLLFTFDDILPRTKKDKSLAALSLKVLIISTGD